MSNHRVAKEPLIKSLLQVFQPRYLLPSLISGLIVSVIAVIVSTAFASLIFSGELSPYLHTGIALMLFASIIAGGFAALTSSLPGLVSGVQDSAAAMLAIMAATIVQTMPPTATSEEYFFTVVGAIALSTIFTGIFFFVFGQFKLGNLIRFIPYPIIAGFLAGTGLLLVLGAFSVIVEGFSGVADFSLLLQGELLLDWLPSFVFGVLLLIVLNRFDHPLIMPAMLLGAMVIFQILPGQPLNDIPDNIAKELGSSFFIFNLEQVQWSILLKQTGSGVAIAVVSVIALLLNASGIELATERDIDLNRELKVAGISNILAGLGGGMVGSHVLGDTTLVYRMGGKSRLVGLVLAGVCTFVLFAGGGLLALFPKPVLGGVLLFLGFDFLLTWVYKAWFKLSLVDFSLVILILFVITFVGFLEGIALGSVLAVALFVMEYSRISVVRHTLSGATYQSNFKQPRLYEQLLRQKGDWIYILELQGFIFFGTAHTLLKKISQRVENVQIPAPRFIVLDFRRVNGLDSSAIFSFARMKQLAISKGVVLVFTHLSEKMQYQLEKEILEPEDSAAWRVFSDMDRGVEWCESHTIKTLKSVGITPKIKEHQGKANLSVGKLENLYKSFAEEYLLNDAVAEGAFDMAILTPHMEEMDVVPGDILIRQGDDGKGLYYLETGLLTAQLEQDDGQTVRLSTMSEKIIVGEVSFYLGTPASASVLVNQPSKIYFLSTEKLAEMENTMPEITTELHKFMAQNVSERLLNTTNRLDALLK